jgi:hypothetical protein
MPAHPLYKFKVEVISDEVITFGTIIRSPRIYKPLDLQSAKLNLRISKESGEGFPALEPLVHYLLADFFVYLHRTGLYNRQRYLWEALARIAGVRVYQLQGGLFRNNPLPAFDIQFLDYRERQLLVCRYIESPSQFADKGCLRLLNSFIAQSAKVPGLLGVFVVCRQEFPDVLCRRVAKITQAEDPVGRYESLLPKPLSIPIDLLVMSTADDGKTAVRLVHPNLQAGKRSYPSSAGVAG